MIVLMRFASGRRGAGTESYVFRPIIIALVVPGTGGREVTRAKNDMSVLIRGQGSVPEWPMPRRIGVLLLLLLLLLSVVLVGVVIGVGMGVVATMRVKGRGVGGILVVILLRRIVVVVVMVVGRYVLYEAGRW